MYETGLSSGFLLYKRILNSLHSHDYVHVEQNDKEILAIPVEWIIFNYCENEYNVHNTRGDILHRAVEQNTVNREV